MYNYFIRSWVERYFIIHKVSNLYLEIHLFMEEMTHVTLQHDMGHV